jgi:hypothetical protein
VDSAQAELLLEIISDVRRGGISPLPTRVVNDGRRFGNVANTGSRLFRESIRYQGRTVAVKVRICARCYPPMKDFFPIPGSPADKGEEKEDELPNALLPIRIHLKGPVKWLSYFGSDVCGFSNLQISSVASVTRLCHLKATDGACFSKTV